MADRPRTPRPPRDQGASAGRGGDRNAGRGGQSRPERDGRRGPPRAGERAGAARGERAGRPSDRRSERPTDRPTGRRVDDGAETRVFPPIDTDVEPGQLDRLARRELSSLDKEQAEFVAKHLVMASRLVEDNPQAAHAHALAALAKGSRIPVVRETLGITAYLTGDFALALRELRTHRRLSGSDVNVPMMIDCERGLGRPKKGIELAGEVQRDTLPPAVAVELAIALSGARLDLGQTERALWELEVTQLDPTKAFSYSPALFDAYALVLEDLGRIDEAARWGALAEKAASVLAQAEGDADELVVLDADDPSAPDDFPTDDGSQDDSSEAPQ